MSFPPPSPASRHQDSMKRYRRYSSLDPPGRFLTFWTRADSLPPFSPASISGSMKTTVVLRSCRRTLKVSTSSIETGRHHRRHFFLQPSSAPIWRKRHWHERAMASPARWHWMLHVRILWRRSARRFVSRDVSAVNCAPFLPSSPHCTKCRHDDPLP